MPQNPGMWFCLVNSLPISTPSHLKTLTYASKERKFSSALLSWPSISGGKMREYFLGRDDHWGLLVIHRHIVSTWDVGFSLLKAISRPSKFEAILVLRSFLTGTSWCFFLCWKCLLVAATTSHGGEILIIFAIEINHDYPIYIHYPLWFLFEELCFLTFLHHIHTWHTPPSMLRSSSTESTDFFPHRWLREIAAAMKWSVSHLLLISTSPEPYNSLPAMVASYKKHANKNEGRREFVRS